MTVLASDHRPAVRLAFLVLVLVMLVLVSACQRTRTPRDTAYIARDVETLYTLARDTLERRQYRSAAELFDEVERQHPYSIWARRAQLMSAYAHYAARQYPEAILSAQRFLALHPGNRDAPYAHYIIAMSHYERIADIHRDQQVTQQALDAMQELVRRFPDSRYAADARLKIDLLNDQLAGKEMQVGRFYAQQRQWIAAARRFRNVVERYQTTSHVPEALHRLVEANLAMGIREEARRSASVLGANFPGSPWYERTWRLLERHDPAAIQASG